MECGSRGGFKKVYFLVYVLDVVREIMDKRNFFRVIVIVVRWVDRTIYVIGRVGVFIDFF